MTKEEEYRQQAKKYGEMAATTSSPLQKQLLLGMQESCLALAGSERILARSRPKDPKSDQ